MKAIHQILKEEQEISTTNTSRLILASDFKNLYLTNADGDLFLTVDSLIRLNNLVTGSRNIGLRTCNIKPAGFKRQYMEANKIEAALYWLLDDFNDRRISHREFVLQFLNEIHPFADGNGRTCKVLFVDKIRTSIYADWNGFYIDCQTSSIALLDVHFPTIEHLFERGRLYC